MNVCHLCFFGERMCPLLWMLYVLTSFSPSPPFMLNWYQQCEMGRPIIISHSMVFYDCVFLCASLFVCVLPLCVLISMFFCFLFQKMRGVRVFFVCDRTTRLQISFENANPTSYHVVIYPSTFISL